MDPELDAARERRSLVMGRILVLALTASLGLFSLVAVFLVERHLLVPRVGYEARLTLLFALGAVCAADLVLGAVLRELGGDRLRAAAAEPGFDLNTAFLREIALFAALAEGAGLFGAVVYLLTGLGWALVPTAAALAILLRLLPQRDAVRRFARRAETTPR